MWIHPQRTDLLAKLTKLIDNMTEAEGALMVDHNSNVSFIKDVSEIKLPCTVEIIVTRFATSEMLENIIIDICLEHAKMDLIIECGGNVPYDRLPCRCDVLQQVTFHK